MKIERLEEYERGEPARITHRIVIDIETGLADEAGLEIEKQVLRPAGNIKDVAKKAENLAAKQEAVSGKDGALDSNPIKVIGIRYKRQYILFTAGFELSEADQAKVLDLGVNVVNSRNEKRMLRRFAQFCNNELIDGDVRLIAWNGYDFDFRRLKFRYAAKKVQLPGILSHGSGTWYVDLMKKFAEITVNADLKKCVSLKTACLLLGVKYSKTIDGKDIPTAIKDGNFFEVIESNLNDLRETDIIAKRLGY